MVNKRAQGPKKIAFYVSGHGLGHISRQCLVIKGLLKKRPGTTIFLRTSAPRWFIREALGNKVRISRVDSGFGARQKDSLILDKKGTLKDFAKFYRTRNTFYRNEEKFLARERIDAVVTDFSPLALKLAAKNNIPAIGMANFTWDWIYAPYAREFPVFKWIPSAIRELHQSCTLMLRFPFHHHFRGFSKIEELPIFANRSSRSKKEIRAKLGISGSKPLILFSFGGFSIRNFSSSWVETQKEYTLLASETSRLIVPNLKNLNRQKIKKAGLVYCDLIKAADCVITKPGYGILTDCLANGTGIIYTPRGEFAEYPVLARAIRERLKGLQVSNRTLLKGDLGKTLTRFFRQRGPISKIAENGARVAAGKILKYI